MGKKILGILGSPRKNGKVAFLLKTVLDACAASGHTVKQVDLYNLNLEYCRGCMVCREKGCCIINDDLNSLAEEIIAYDVVVLAAPTYWANVPAIVKNLFDRMVAYMMKDTKGKSYLLPPKPLRSKNQGYILITSCNTTFPFNFLFHQSSGALSAMSEFFKTSGMSKIGTLTMTNAWIRDEIPDGLMARAAQLGRAI
jgi:multimeric flavodoxin WrbA